MIGGDSFGGLLDLRRDGAVVLLKVLGVLQDAVEVFLSTERHTKPPLLLNSGKNGTEMKFFFFFYFSSSTSCFHFLLLRNIIRKMI